MPRACGGQYADNSPLELASMPSARHAARVNAAAASSRILTVHRPLAPAHDSMTSNMTQYASSIALTPSFAMKSSNAPERSRSSNARAHSTAFAPHRARHSALKPPSAPAHDTRTASKHALMASTSPSMRKSRRSTDVWSAGPVASLISSVSRARIDATIALARALERRVEYTHTKSLRPRACASLDALAVRYNTARATPRSSRH